MAKLRGRGRTAPHQLDRRALLGLASRGGCPHVDSADTGIRAYSWKLDITGIPK